MVFDLARLVELLDNVAVICLFAYLLTRTKYSSVFVYKKLSLFSIIFMSVTGGILYFYNILTGVWIGPYFISLQVIGPIIAGIISGPIAGFAAAVIGISLQLISGYNIESGDFAVTLLSGLIGGIYWYWNKEKLFKVSQIFLIGCLIGFLQFFAGVRGVEPYALDQGEILEAILDLFLPAIAGLCIFAFIINNFRIEEDKNRKTYRIEGELEAARKIQMKSLPPSHKSWESISLSASLIPASYIGGDLYDYMSLKDGIIYFALGDVSGKGIPAALLMSSTHTLLRSLVKEIQDPALIIKEINYSFLNDGDYGQFITLIVGFINSESGEVDYCNAGHPPPFLMTSVGSKSLESEGNLPAGVIEDEIFVPHHLIMNPGETLILVSDGLTEAERGDELYGTERVIQRLNIQKTGNPDDIISALLDDVSNWTGDEKIKDDCTILAINYSPCNQ